MISGNDFWGGLRAVMAMARGDRDWATHMDMSVQGVFASFWSFALALPLIVLVNLCERELAVAQTVDAPLLLAPVSIYVISFTVIRLITWGGTLALLVAVVRQMGATWHITPFIIGYNWSTFVTYGVLAFGLSMAMAAPASGLATPILFAIFIFALWLDWGVIRRALGLPIGAVVGLIVLTQAVGILATGLLIGLVEVVVGPANG